MARNKSYVFFALNAELPESAGPIGGAGLSLVPLALDRDRSKPLVLRSAVLDCGGSALAVGQADAVPPADDRSRYGLGDRRPGARRSLFRQRRSGGRARRRHSPCLRFHRAVAARLARLARMKDASPAHRGRLRRLSDEEIALWLTVAKSVTPRPEAHLPDAGDPPPKMVSAPPAPTATPAPREKAGIARAERPQSRADRAQAPAKTFPRPGRSRCGDRSPWA